MKIFDLLILIISIKIIFIIISFTGKIKIPQKKLDKEEYIIKKKYPLNVLFRYSNKQENSFIIKKIDISKDNSTFEFTDIMDFIFIVRESYLEKDEKNLIEKEWYTGYIGFLNVTLIYSTNSKLYIYDKSLSEILNKNNSRRLDNIDDVVDENKLCFAKIDFYKNGDIKKYYIPKEFSKANFQYIEETAKLIIPKISKNLFVNNINEKLNEICSKNKEKNDDKINQLNNFSYRNLNFENLAIESKIESIEYNLIEVNKLNESLNNLNLTEFSFKSTDCDKIGIEGGMTNSNTTKFSFINEDGILESVVEKTIFFMNMNNYEENKEEEEDHDEDTQILKSKVYNENNEKTLDNITNEKNVNNSSSFYINNITTLSSHIINCTDNFTNENINQKLYKYFDSFDYIEYNKTDKEMNFSRILEENNDSEK